MKRITTLLLAVAFTLGSVCAAQADGIDIKVKGQWDFAFGWVNNRHFKDNANSSNPSRRRSGINNGQVRDNDNFEARQRVRVQINFITSEYLQGLLHFEIGDLDWGRTTGGTARAARHTGGGLDADGVNIETKRAFIDWMIPNTPVSVRMGIQGLKLPSTRMGSPVFDTDVAGIVVSSPITDWMSITGFWIRPFDAYANDGWDESFSDEVDAFGLIVPLDFNGFKFSPWFIYGFVGANSGIYDYLYTGSFNNTVTAQNSRTHVWWAGMTFDMTFFDPLKLSVEGIYGRLSQADLTGFGGLEKYGQATSVNQGTQGWYIGATLDYKLSWGTPGIFGWYASGDDANSDHSGKMGRLPVLGTDGGSSFKPTSFGTHGYYGIGNGNNSVLVTGTGTGTWGVGIQLADVSFIEDLSHTLRFAYYRGTNDSDLVRKGGDFFGYNGDSLYLTNDDSVFEVNFDHKYKIYENLTAVLELGYLHLSSDKSTWRRYNNSYGRHKDMEETDDAWKAEINFRYEF